MLKKALSREERDRYIAENLDENGRLKNGLSPRTFVANTADATVRR